VKVGSLFSGIGGLDLGLERAGMTVIWQSEIDPYASRVLAKHWPDVPNLGDITKIDWSTVERPDLICGGYPCQPFSLAGRRQGEDDPRHLWPLMRDAIRVLRPRWALLENVPGHLALGFGQVLGELAECGYDCEWDCIPAAAVGAPHLRYRVFVVAHAGRQGRRQDTGSTYGDEAADAGRTPLDNHVTNGDGQGGGTGDVADADHSGRCKQRRTSSVPTQLSAAQCRSQWAVEPNVGRVAHGVPSRVDRLRCLGNAVVPQVAEWIGHRIMEAAA
jgi:DNA (cytosine-5)-methyltransferase 1